MGFSRSFIYHLFDIILTILNDYTRNLKYGFIICPIPEAKCDEHLTGILEIHPKCMMFTYRKSFTVYHTTQWFLYFVPVQPFPTASFLGSH